MRIVAILLILWSTYSVISSLIGLYGIVLDWQNHRDFFKAASRLKGRKKTNEN